MLKGTIRITHGLLKREERIMPPKKKMRQKEMSLIFYRRDPRRFPHSENGT